MKFLLSIMFVILLAGCEEVPVSRPLDQISINSDYCVCKEGRPVNLSTSCENKCSEQDENDQDALLFLTVDVGPELQSSQFKDLEGWCSQLLVDPNTGTPIEVGNPDCELVFTNKDTNLDTIISIDTSQHISGNSISSVALNVLESDTPYFFTIRETVSQLNSDVRDVVIRTDIFDDFSDIPLTIEPIAQYACITNADSTDLVLAEKVHFYYDAENRPDPSISTMLDSVYCHEGSGVPTNSTPLLDNTHGQILLWSKGDIRFGSYTDDSGVSIPDTLKVDMIITDLYEQVTGLNINTTIKLFNEFQYVTDPISASESEQKLLGYMMNSLRDSDSLEWYCPDSSHYYADNADPLMKVLREVIVNDTQAIYYAQQENKKNDYIFITEEDVKDAWFYLDENNQEIAPTDSTIRGKNIHFYWPISKDSPFEKKSYQVRYTIQSPDEDANPADIPDDKRLGCVPRI